MIRPTAGEARLTDGGSRWNCCPADAGARPGRRMGRGARRQWHSAPAPPPARWALIVAAHGAEAAREALDAYDRENADTADVGADAVAPVRGAAAVGVAVGLLLIVFFAVTGTRASRSAWFERGP